MIGVEIDFVVSDSIKALETYEKIFDIQRVEVSNYERGLNEDLYDVWNALSHARRKPVSVGRTAPRQSAPMWINVLVPDIERTLRYSLQ